MPSKPLNWREKRNRTLWYTGPSEGTTIYYAKRNGVVYTVQAAFRDPMARSGGVVWHAFAGTHLGAFTHIEHAKGACERKAGAP